MVLYRHEKSGQSQFSGETLYDRTIKLTFISKTEGRTS